MGGYLSVSRRSDSVIIDGNSFNPMRHGNWDNPDVKALGIVLISQMQNDFFEIEPETFETLKKEANLILANLDKFEPPERINDSILGSYMNVLLRFIDLAERENGELYFS